MTYRRREASLNTCSARGVQAISWRFTTFHASTPFRRNEDDPFRRSGFHRRNFDALDAWGARGRRGRGEVHHRDEGGFAHGEGVCEGRTGGGQEDDERDGQEGEGGWAEVHLRRLPQGPGQLRADQERDRGLQEARSRREVTASASSGRLSP